MLNQPCTLTLALVLSACTLLAPRAGFAATATDSAVQQQASEAGNRLQWTVEASDSVATRVEVRQSVERRVMAYRFRVDVNQTLADDASIGSLAWDAEVRVIHADGVDVLHLTHGTPEQTLPTLLGVELMAGDSVVVTVTFDRRAAHAVHVRLTIDHDPINKKDMRTAGRAFRVDPSVTEGGLVSTWEWKNEVDGRLRAVTGALREGAAGMRLIDLTTGEECWSDGPSSYPTSSSTGIAVQRFGVSVVAGHTYRLTVERKHAPKGMIGGGFGSIPVATAIIVQDSPLR